MISTMTNNFLHNSKNVSYNVGWTVLLNCGTLTSLSNFVTCCCILSSSESANRHFNRCWKTLILPLSVSRLELLMVLLNWSRRKRIDNCRMISLGYWMLLILIRGIWKKIDRLWISKRKSLNKDCINNRHLTRKQKKKRVKRRMINWHKRKKRKKKKWKLEWKSSKKSKSNSLKDKLSSQTSKSSATTQWYCKNCSTCISKY